MLDIKGNKRLEGEKFKKYKKRRATENRVTKLYLKGRMFWFSKFIETVNTPSGTRNIISGNGTYRRESHA